MPQLILLPNEENNSLSIFIPSTQELSFEQIIERVVPSGSPYKVVLNSDLPEDRNFLDAWETDFSDTQAGVTINMDKAKEIHRRKVRIARIPKFSELDILFMKCLEVGGDTSYIEMKKNLLRDATQTPEIESATTVEELKNSWDFILLGPSPYTQV